MNRQLVWYPDMTVGRPRMRRARGARVRFYFFLLLRRARCARAWGAACTRVFVQIYETTRAGVFKYRFPTADWIAVYNIRTILKYSILKYIRISQCYIPDTRHRCFGFRGFPVITLLKKKWSMGPKNCLERRAWQFYTICDKNKGLKVKIDEVTANLVPRSGQASCSWHWALRKSLYGALWWIFRKSVVTFLPHGATLASARILQFVTVLAQFEHLRPGRWWEVV
jgi:hypothetical protein